MGRMMRAVVVYDIDINGSLKDAAQLDDMLNTFAEGFMAYVEEHDYDLREKVHVSQTLAGVPLQERRGATGSLEAIVFRGTRGPNLKVQATIPKAVSPEHRKKLTDLKKQMRKSNYPEDMMQEALNVAHDHLLEGIPAKGIIWDPETKMLGVYDTE